MPLRSKQGSTSAVYSKLFSFDLPQSQAPNLNHALPDKTKPQTSSSLLQLNKTKIISGREVMNKPNTAGP